MLLALPDPDILYAALLARDPSYDGHAFVGVTTTGVFCRLTCPARKPKFENTRFFDSIPACLDAGFRSCLRCRPLDRARGREPLVAALMRRLDENPDRNWSTGDLVGAGFEPSTVRRAFKRHFGMTFLDLARLRRTGRGLDRLAEGDTVIEAQLESGFESGSGFRGAVTQLIGEAPAALKGRALLKADWIETPIGTMLAVADRHALHLLEFFDRKALPSELGRLGTAARSSIAFGRLPPIDLVESELQAYFEGRVATFSTPLALHGSPFTRKTWAALRAIPLGTTRSYAQVAAGLGQPTAARAVARANGANQIAIIIPCHRIVGLDGALTATTAGCGGKSGSSSMSGGRQPTQTSTGS